MPTLARFRRGGVALAAALLALLAWRGLALAHAELTASEPAAGSTVPEGLSRVILAFTEPPRPGSSLTLYTGVFQAVPGVTSYIANGQLWGDITPALTAGTYTVQWSVVSADGHTAEGSYQFAVADPPAPFLWASLLVMVLLLVLIGGLPFVLARFVRR